jgi:DNA-binding IclR family transcriptional regulator
MAEERAPYQAPALERGLEIIERLAAAHSPMTVAELGRVLGRSRSELFRMVIVLERAGYLARAGDDRYVLTRKLFDVAMDAPPQRTLLEAAMPAMQRLSSDCRQSCHMALQSGPDIVVIARVESPDLLGFSLRVGFRRPLNLSASGRVLYAFQSEA